MIRNIELQQNPPYFYVYLYFRLRFRYSAYGQMFFQPDIRFWPKVKNIISVIHWKFLQVGTKYTAISSTMNFNTQPIIENSTSTDFIPIHCKYLQACYRHVIGTGNPLIGRFLGPRKNCLNRNPSYQRSFYGINMLKTGI